MLNWLFKPKSYNVNALVRNNDCKALLQEVLISPDADKIIAMIVIYEIASDKRVEGVNFRETYHKTAGLQPYDAIIMADQLHHRLQHEGLEKY